MVEVSALWVGLCDECCSAKPFASERERDLWERHHTHDQGQSGGLR